MNASNVLKMEQLQLTDDEQSGQTSTSRSKPLIAQAKNSIHKNYQLNVQEVAEKAGISIGSRLVFDDLQKLLQRANDKNILKYITTGDRM
jgi:hypothetical protein